MLSRINSSKFVIRVHDCTLQTCISIPLPYDIHGSVQTLMTFAVFFVREQRELYSGICRNQIGTTHTDAAQWLCSGITGLEQSECSLGDFHAVASGRFQFSLPDKTAKVFIANSDFDNGTLHCQFPHSRCNALG